MGIENFFNISRSARWQVFAAVVIGALFGRMGAVECGQSGVWILAGVVGGAVVGLLAAAFLLWVDAGQRQREAKNPSQPAPDDTLLKMDDFDLEMRDSSLDAKSNQLQPDRTPQVGIFTRLAREFTGLTFREKILGVCVIVGLCLGAVAIVCKVLMNIVHMVEFFRTF